MVKTYCKDPTSLLLLLQPSYCVTTACVGITEYPYLPMLLLSFIPFHSFPDRSPSLVLLRRIC
jgi:hypothetical protein